MDIPRNIETGNEDTQFPLEMDGRLNDTTDDGLLGRDYVRGRHASNASASSLPAGEMLMSPLPTRKTGGEIVDTFVPRKDYKCDSVVTADEVLRSLDNDNETIVFKPEGASEAVKHFFSDELRYQSTFSPNDRVDAGGDMSGDEDLDSVDVPQPHLGVTSQQHKGAEPFVRNISTHEDDFRYKMNRPERGCFVIFNQFTFDQYNEGKNEQDHLHDRKGTQKDALNLEHTAKQLGFEYVKVIDDATKSQIKQWIQMLSTANHSNYDCFGCAILTHGGERDVLYARDAQMNLKDFTRPFGADLCDTLAGKPKLFFIQACRGVMFDPGKKMVLLSNTPDSVDGRLSSSGDAVDGGAEKEVTIPAEADFLIANSTVPEYYSWRNESNGSFFVQSLCAILNQFGDTMELMQMMTRVNRMVGYDYESSTLDEASNKKKQIPSVATRLTAEVFFTPKPTQSSGIQASCSPPSTSAAYAHCETSVSKHTADGTHTLVEETTAIQLQSYPAPSNPQVRATMFFPQNSPTQPPSHRRKTFYPDPKPSSPARRNAHKATLTPQNSPSQVSLTFQSSSRQGRFSRGPSSTPITVPITGTRYIPGRRKLSGSGGHSRSLETKTIHKSETVPKNIGFLCASPLVAPRLTSHRFSLPDNKRVVVQDRDRLLTVAGRKTNQRFVESDI